jgi:broad-specificity NMP kinase
MAVSGSGKTTVCKLLKKLGSRHAPKDVTNEIESLYIINSIDDSTAKIEEVKALLPKYC